jgi:hypothetical protein
VEICGQLVMENETASSEGQRVKIADEFQRGSRQACESLVGWT